MKKYQFVKTDLNPNNSKIEFEINSKNIDIAIAEFKQIKPEYNFIVPFITKKTGYSIGVIGDDILINEF